MTGTIDDVAAEPRAPTEQRSATGEPPRRAADPSDPELAPLPRGRPLGWWGMVWLIATESMLFGGLLSAWFFTGAVSDSWPQGDIEAPDLLLPGIFTVVLLGSSIPIAWAEVAIRRHDRMTGVRVALATSWVMGAAFLGHQVYEYLEMGFGLGDNAYASLFYVITSLHGIHLLIGLVMGAVVQLKAGTGRLGPDRHLTFTVFALYWHFVDVVWIGVFSSLYLATNFA